MMESVMPNMSETEINGHPARILVVDDDSMLRTLIRIKLKKNGYDVIEAADGVQALEAFRASHPDIVLMDANMPGKDGFTATEELKQQPEARSTPILMVSGLEDDDSVDRAFSVGATEYITKPICWPLLLHRLKNICAAMRAEINILQAKNAADKANQSKSEFLANMSHELRTPMHAILSFSSMGVNKVGSADAEKLTRYFTRIEESGKRLLTLLNDLLDLSKLEAGRMEVDMHDEDMINIVNTVISEMDGLIQQKQLSLQVSPPEVATTVACDAEKMMQVMRNLLSNAVKFTPEGKCIRVSFDNITTDDAHSNPRRFVLVTVSDQGVGIPDDELEQVFDKFVQSSKTKTGAGGTGLGLAITKEIVELHGGSICAKSNEEGGASFIFTIPAVG